MKTKKKIGVTLLAIAALPPSAVLGFVLYHQPYIILVFVYVAIAAAGILLTDD